MITWRKNHASGDAGEKVQEATGGRKWKMSLFGPSG